MEARILEDWIKRYFVARNAALWVMGPLPDDLFVSLEPGSRTPASPFRTISGFEGPAMLQEDIGAVGASFLVDRGLAVQVAMRTVEQHLRRALRVDRGLGYAVGADYRPVSKEQAIAWVYASCLPEKVAEVQRFMLETIDDVAARGASEDEIATFFEQYLRDGTDPMAFPMRLDRRVQDELMGVEAKPLAEQIDAMWRIQPGEVAEAFRAARDTMLLLLPINAVPPNRAFKPYPGAMPGPIGDGQTFDYLAEKGSKYKGRMPKLFVGSRGLYLDTPAGRVVTILWPDCVAVVKDEHVRSVLSRDGSSIVIGPERWRNGYNAVALVDRYSPSSVVVP